MKININIISYALIIEIDSAAAFVT